MPNHFLQGIVQVPFKSALDWIGFAITNGSFFFFSLNVLEEQAKATDESESKRAEIISSLIMVALQGTTKTDTIISSIFELKVSELFYS